MKSIFIATAILIHMVHASAQAGSASPSPAFELQHLVREPRTAVPNPPVLFLLHGAGSNEHDLFTFAARIPDEWLVISARAPYTVSEGHHKWYDVKMVGQKITINVAQAEESRNTILRFMDQVAAHYHADRGRVVLAGFSQGANMSAIVGLTEPARVSGFAVFSGRYIEEFSPQLGASAALKAVACFMAHGNQDNMLPIAYARENERVLQSLGMQVRFSEDAVGHSISSKQFDAFLSWLNER